MRDIRNGMRRVFDPEDGEWMDREQPVSDELAVDLENLRKINSWFGGYSLVRKFLRHWLQPERNYRLLDLACGYADIPRMIVDWARAREVTVMIDAVERQSATLEIAKRASEQYPEIRFIRQDALTYDSPQTYDVVLSTLALHHFSNEDAVKLLRRARALSHDAILISDLERTGINRALIWTMTSALFREPMTVHDARISIARAFSFREFDALARRAGWEGFDHRRFPPARQAIWMHVRDLAPIAELAAPEFNPAIP